MTAERSKPDVSIVIGTFNRGWHLKRTIASVRAEMSQPESEIVVVDGGSNDGTLRWLMRQRDVITIVQHNHGTWNGRVLPRRSWGYFMNLGFKVASAPYICMLSDDSLVVPGAIRNGIRLFEEKAGEKIGAVAFYWRNWPEQKEYNIGLTFGGHVFVNHGLFAREALVDVSYIDETTFRFYHADGDLALRMNVNGWKCVESPDSYVEHCSHANVPLRYRNAEGQPADWAAYRERWSYLGAPEQDWLTREYSDSSCTAVRYWGRRQRQDAILAWTKAKQARLSFWSTQ